MLKKIYKKLEFDLVLDKIARKAQIKYNGEAIQNTRHLIDYDKVMEQLNKTSEIMSLFSAHSFYSLGGFYNVLPYLKKIENHEILESLELKQLANQYQVIINLNEYAKNIDKEKYPYFSSVLDNLDDIVDIAKEIDFKIDDSGMIYEDATPTLVRINSEIEMLQIKIAAYLKKFINDNQIHLMENLITYRNNRAVIPVKLASKNIIKGIIHDESSSKQTMFIEPSQVVEYNNDIQSLEYERNQEIKIILEDLSKLVRNNIFSFHHNFKLLCELDIVKAKALYSNEIDGIIPKINKDSAKLEIFNGAHPLINKESVIRNDFYICNDDSKYRVVLISGSNTGGKTVALKMVGLFSLMVQSGIAISALENTNLPIYKKIFVDIGDEQSIVESLSTFSAHLSNVANIINNVCKYSLVLLDELGSGTDPREGENLALAIIEYLYKKDASIILTTHFSKLKTFALTTDYVRPASVMFDIKSARPMYKIQFDTYAASNAFEIANLLGVKKSIIENAQKKYQDDLSTSDEIMLKLASQQQEVNKKRDELELELNLIKQKQNKLELEKLKLEENSKKILEQAKAQANDIVNEAKTKSGLIIKELKSKGTFVNHEVNALNKSLDELYQVEEKVEIDNEFEFALNDIVEVVKVKRQGEITKILNKNTFEVSIGNLKTKVKRNEIVFVSKKKKEVEKKQIKSKTKFSTNVKMELNLIGLRVEDALIELQKYLDSALLANYSKVRIVHGFGTGALRKAVHEYLRKAKYVKSYHFAEYNEGGQGATIVELK